MEFPTSNAFSLRNGIDTRYPALINEKKLKEFLTDLRDDNKMDLQTKRAVILQILCVNRPANTASVKWEYLDLEQGVWSIPATQIKMRYAHKIALSIQALKIFNEQRQYVPIQSDFVFPAITKIWYINRDSVSKAIRNLGGKDKYHSVATSHGFRATFRTICSLHMAELMQLGISDKTIENALAHKELDNVKYAYERQTASLEQNRILMQWYADYLNSIVQFI